MRGSANVRRLARKTNVLLTPRLLNALRMIARHEREVGNGKIRLPATTIARYSPRANDRHHRGGHHRIDTSRQL